MDRLTDDISSCFSTTLFRNSVCLKLVKSVLGSLEFLILEEQS